MGVGDPARVILSVLAAAKGVPSDDVRAWLRSRGNAEVRATASARGTFQSLYERSESYLASYSPERVRSRSALRVVRGLSSGLPAPEAALLALLALDMMESGKDGALLTRALSVTMGSTQKSVTNRADSLETRGLLRIAARQTGVPTRVRLRKSDTRYITEQTEALIADLSAGTDSRLTDLFYAVRSPALSYTDLGYDAWYVSLCDALNIRKATIPASRSSRARTRMRELAGTDDLLEALRTLETSEVVRARGEAEAARQEHAAVRAIGSAENRERKQIAYAWVEALDIPRKGAQSAPLAAFITSATESAASLDPAVQRFAAEALTTELRKRLWEEERVEKVLSDVFRNRRILRWVAAHGAVPHDPGGLVKWVATALPADDRMPAEMREHFSKVERHPDDKIDELETRAAQRKRVGKYIDAHGAAPREMPALAEWQRLVWSALRDKDGEAIYLRRYLVSRGIAASTAARAFPDGRLDKFYVERGAAPQGTDRAAMGAWVNQDAARAPRRAEASLRFDLEAAGWEARVIDAALPHLLIKRKG